MKIEYTRRALADLSRVGVESLAFGDAVATAVRARLEQLISRIADFPESAPRVAGETNLRVVPLVRYPYRIFYRVFPDRVRILHIRHTSRREWRG